MPIRVKSVSIKFISAQNGQDFNILLLSIDISHYNNFIGNKIQILNITSDVVSLTELPFKLYRLTHIGKLYSGDFPETFSKKSFSDIVTSLRTIIERGHVA